MIVYLCTNGHMPQFFSGPFEKRLSCRWRNDQHCVQGRYNFCFCLHRGLMIVYDRGSKISSKSSIPRMCIVQFLYVCWFSIIKMGQKLHCMGQRSPIWDFFWQFCIQICPGPLRLDSLLNSFWGRGESQVQSGSHCLQIQWKQPLLRFELMNCFWKGNESPS